MNIADKKKKKESLNKIMAQFQFCIEVSQTFKDRNYNNLSNHYARQYHKQFNECYNYVEFDLF